MWTKIKILILFNSILIGLIYGQPKCSENGLNLHIVHMNDFHARYIETNYKGNECKKATECIGGFSRNYKQISDIIKDDPETVLLNAGDNFQGTIWYTLFKWNVTRYFMNQVHFDAFTLGNHEFDDNMQGLIPFLSHLTAPMVVSNLDDSQVPEIQKLYQKSIIIERCNKKIGIIGVTTSRTPKTSNPGKVKFLDESESVNKEAERLVTEYDVFTNIVLSHCGYDMDKEMAAKASKDGRITVIVGGHSHSLLYNGDKPPTWDTVEGPYPTVVNRGDGEKVLITQAAAFARYLGNFSVDFGSNGSVVSWTGQPIFMSNDKPTDAAMDKDIDMWREEVDGKGRQVMGRSANDLTMDECRQKECLIGNFVTDAMVHAYTKRRDKEKNEWTYAAIAIANAGGFRANIPEGNVTFKDLITAQPFMNTIDVSDIQGKHLQEVFQYCANAHVDPSIGNRVNWLQVSGLKVVFAKNPKGNTVKSIKVRCQKCDSPKYEDLDPEETYRILTPSFLTNGGDTFTMLKDYLKNTEVGPEDVTVLRDYLEDKSPVKTEIEGRLVFE